MSTTHKATWVVTAVALALGAVGLTGCGTSDSASGPKGAEVTTSATPAPSTTAGTPPTKTAPPGSIAVAGYKPAVVAEAARFVEKFATGRCQGAASRCCRSWKT